MNQRASPALPAEPRAAVRPHTSPPSLPSHLPTGPGGVGGAGGGRQAGRCLQELREPGHTMARGRPPGSRRGSDSTGPVRKTCPSTATAIQPLHTRLPPWAPRVPGQGPRQQRRPHSDPQGQVRSPWACHRPRLPICRTKGQTRCPTLPPAATQGSADPSGHWTSPSPAAGTSSAHPEVFSVPRPAASSRAPAPAPPAARQAGWAVGASAWALDGPKAWDSPTAPGLRAGATAQPLPSAPVPGG